MRRYYNISDDLIVPVIVGLSAGTGLIVLFATFTIPMQQISMPMIPKITEQQAIDIVVNHMQKQYPAFIKDDMHLYSNGEYVRLEEFFKNEKQLPLFFYHQNGTRFRINDTDHTIMNSCTIEQGCRDFRPEVFGKLLYVFDMDCGRVGCANQIYYVDAIKGTIAYTTLHGDIPETKGHIQPDI